MQIRAMPRLSVMRASIGQAGGIVKMGASVSAGARSEAQETKVGGGMRRIAFGLAAAVALVGIAAAVTFRPDMALRVATGFTAHTLCSWAFLDARDPGVTFREDVATEPGMGLLAPLLRFAVDRAEKEARVSVMGFFGARARFTDGRGCRLVQGSETPLAPLLPPRSSAPPLEIDQPRPAVEAAFDRAFASPSQGPPRHTRAIVVLRDGRIAAERYANGFSPTTVFWGHSLSKSVTHALLGILAMAGRFDPDAPADVPEWRDAGDARATITAGELMRMTAGFPPDETWPGWDRSSRMWFVEDDEAAFAASEQPTDKPGVAWAYHNGGVVLLSRMIRNRSGVDAQDFVRSALFEPTGMTSAIIEADGAGTPDGSAFVWATARDWARFGQLYLDDGVVAGRRVLPSGWAEAAATPTVQADRGYGALFWTNRGDSAGAKQRRAEGIPADSYEAFGYEGQWVVIAPRARLVVVRLGDDWSAEHQGVPRLVGELVGAFGQNWR